MRLGGRRHEADRLAAATGPAGAANAVDVVVGRARQVEVDDHRQGLDVQAARGDVGGHQHLHLLRLERIERAGASALAQVAMEGRGAQAQAGQLAGHQVGPVAAGHEHQHPVLPGRLHQVAQQQGAAVFVHHDGALVDVGPRCHRTGQVHLMRLVQQAVGQRLHRGRQGGRAQHRLAPRRQQGQHPLQLVGKAQVQQAVGFVQHQRGHLVQVHGVVLHQVQQAAGGGHQDVGAAAQAHHLRVDRHPTHGHADLDQAGQVVRQLTQGLAHLHRQLAGGHQHQAAGGAGRLRAALQPLLQQRQHISGRLA